MNSVKKNILKLFGDAINHSFKENKLNLFTTFGLVSGTYIDESHIEEEDIANLLMQTHQKIASTCPENENPCIILKDVTIKGQGLEIRLPIITIFADQVIGVTIGNFN